MSLIIRCDTIGCSNSIVAYSTRVNTKRAIAFSFTILIHHTMIKVLSCNSLLSTTESIHSLTAACSNIALMTSITRSHVLHEVTIKHSLTHLCLLLICHILVLLVSTKSSNSCLIEHLLLLIHLVHIWQHFMDS